MLPGDLDALLLRRAARLALRGHGRAEPNPCVGCVITDAQGTVVGEGFHAQCGGPHAEVNALRAAGSRARSGIVYVTLEPCAHEGRTPPCTDALIAAGVRRVVAARLDPTEAAGNGGRLLTAAGIEFIVHPEPAALQIGDPWVRRVTTGLPFVTVKWAQTLDGRIAAQSGDSRWISSPRSRAMVHRERGRSDIILTGIGTVRADDPHLVARDVQTRRTARRVIIDPRLEIEDSACLLRTIADAPLTIVTTPAAQRRGERRIEELQRIGADVMVIGPPDDVAADRAEREIDLTHLLRELVQRFAASHVLVEAGPGLTTRLVKRGLVSMLWVFIAPRLIGDDRALPPVGGLNIGRISESHHLTLLDHRRRGDDIVLRYLLESRA